MACLARLLAVQFLPALAGAELDRDQHGGEQRDAGGYEEREPVPVGQRAGHARADGVRGAGGGRRGQDREPDREAIARSEAQIIETFEGQTSAVYTSARLLDDGVIDPRDTRRVIGLTLAVCHAGRRRALNPKSFGVGRS